MLDHSAFAYMSFDILRRRLLPYFQLRLGYRLLRLGEHGFLVFLSLLLKLLDRLFETNSLFLNDL